MKVIRHGNRYREVECKECGALLSYFASEVRHAEYKGLHNYSKEFITCPECKKEIFFSYIVDGEETVKC